jgi:uncharacterized protein (UPF0548 family)
MAYDKARLVEKVSMISINTNKSIESINLKFLFNYKIFPDNIMSYLTQWEAEKREMKIGDTIVQQVYLPPNKAFSQKIIFGVRINEMINTPYKIGFGYETLEGHVENGVSTFTVEQNNNEVLFKIRTYSAPGNVFTKLLGPVFSVPYQTFCTKSALKNVRSQLESEIYK